MTEWTLRHHTSLDAADAETGGRLADLVGNDAEGMSYLKACDAAPAAGVNPAYLTLADASGPVGFAPCFVTPYNWLPVRKGGKDWPGWLKKIGALRLVAMGSTHANELGVQIDRSAPVSMQAKIFAELLSGLEQLGASTDAHMLLVKDLNDRDAALADPILRAQGYARMVAPPLAYLHLPVGSSAEYLAQFNRQKRRSITRNLAEAGGVEIETGADITGLEPELNALALETRLRAGTQFGGLEAGSERFFGQLADNAEDRAIFTLFRVAGRLIGFSLMLEGKSQMFGKTIGLNYPAARQHKVYFSNLINAIDLTAGRGLDWLCLGQLGYATKLHIGAKLERRWYYVKMRGRYGAGFGSYKRFLEGRRIETESAPHDVPDNYFSAQPDGPQPPAHLIFGPRKQ